VEKGGISLEDENSDTDDFDEFYNDKGFLNTTNNMYDKPTFGGI